LKDVFIFQQWQWPAQGTGTVPVVSAQFCSNENLSGQASCCRLAKEVDETLCRFDDALDTIMLWREQAMMWFVG